MPTLVMPKLRGGFSHQAADIALDQCRIGSDFASSRPGVRGPLCHRITSDKEQELRDFSGERIRVQVSSLSRTCDAHEFRGTYPSSPI